MKDRLAFFATAQNKSSPPPVKSKPAASGLTWSQRQKLRQEQEAKERETGGPAVESVAQPVAPATATVTAPATPGSSQPEKKEAAGAGLSAADAQSSISKGGSLRERMAALQGAGAFGAPAEKPAPPAPSGKTWKRPAAPDPVPGDNDEDGAEGADALAAAGEEQAEGEEETEEEQEKAKRAAIVARMAKLGGRGPVEMAAPPKPATKPARAPEAVVDPPAGDKPEGLSVGNAQPAEAPTTASSPPTSIPIPSMPRRTAPPRRRGPASSAGGTAVAPNDSANSEQRLESEQGGTPPPPQVMVADEEKPLPRTEEQQAAQTKNEDLGRGSRGAEGAAAAGIAMMSANEVGANVEENKREDPLVGAVGGAGTDARGMGTIANKDGAGEIVDNREEEANQVEAGVEEGGPENDEIMREAEDGHLNMEEPDDDDPAARPQPVAMVPLHPPAEAGRGRSTAEEDLSPPPPPRRMMGVPMDEVEMKHEHDAAVAREEADEPSLAPPPRRPISTEWPVGPRPLPSPGKGLSQAVAGEDRPLPAPPVGKAMIPPRNKEEEDREVEGEGDEEEQAREQDEAEEEEAPAPPPPRRQPSMPPPLQVSIPTPGAQSMSPTASSSASTHPSDAVPLTAEKFLRMPHKALLLLPYRRRRPYPRLSHVTSHPRRQAKTRTKPVVPVSRPEWPSLAG